MVTIGEATVVIGGLMLIPSGKTYRVLEEHYCVTRAFVVRWEQVQWAE